MQYLKEIRRGIVISLLGGALLVFLINRYVISVGSENIHGIYGQYTTIVEDTPPLGEGLFPEPYIGVVFGASVASTGKLSPILQERVDKVYELYIQGIISKILITGYDKNRNYLEATSMRVYLMGLGVPGKDLLMDTTGYDTLASMQNLGTFPLSKLILVSQEYHLYRILYYTTYLDAELTYIGIPADYNPTFGQKFIHPRETLARVKAFLEMTALHLKINDELEGILTLFL